MLSDKQEAVMANWVKCTIPSGDKIFVNFDNATAIHRNDVKGQTQVSFIAEKGTLVVKETLDQLLKAGMKT
jgi:hypothetical protein